MKEKVVINTKKAPAAVGPYSQAIKTGELIFVSGQISINPSTGEMVKGNIKEQAEQTLENIKAILEAAGSSLDRVVKATVFIDDMSNFQAVNEIYNHYFVNDFPARVCVQVSRLPLDAKVEIEVVAQI
jgi:2-iminobutanoate/2-iminopropanoate deaminase